MSPVKLDMNDDWIPLPVPSKIEFAKSIIAIEKEIKRIIEIELFLEIMFLKASFSANTILSLY